MSLRRYIAVNPRTDITYYCYYAKCRYTGKRITVFKSISNFREGNEVVSSLSSLEEMVQEDMEGGFEIIKNPKEINKYLMTLELLK